MSDKLFYEFEGQVLIWACGQTAKNTEDRGNRNLFKVQTIKATNRRNSKDIIEQKLFASTLYHRV